LPSTAGGNDAALFGLIPSAVGVANLLYAMIQWKKEQAEEARKQP